MSRSKGKVKSSLSCLLLPSPGCKPDPDFAVQQPDGLWVETVPESAPVKSVRLGGLRGSSEPVEVLDDRQLRPGDMLGSSDLSIDLCLQSFPAVPGCDAARQNEYCGVQSTNLVSWRRKKSSLLLRSRPRDVSSSDPHCC